MRRISIVVFVAVLSSYCSCSSVLSSYIASLPTPAHGETHHLYAHPPPEPGSQEMKDLFMLRKDYLNFNHGSFGSPPRMVLERQWHWQTVCEQAPDPWIRGGYEAQLEKLRVQMGDYLNQKGGRDLVFVENASAGVNAVLRSLNIQPGEAILYLSTAYGMVKNTADYLRQVYGAEVINIPVRFLGKGTLPVGEDGLPVIESVKKVVAARARDIRIAMFSHIASTPAWLLPVEEIARVCNVSNIPVMVDGAHALGQTPVDIQALRDAGVTYWVGNGHKWLYSPKGSAVLWVAPWAQETLVPTVISSAYTTGVVDENSHYLNHFQYTGTKDYTPYVSMLDAMEFRSWVGEDKIMSYNHNLAVWAQEHLATVWGTEILMPSTNTAFLGHVRLPVNTLQDMGRLDANLMTDYGIELTCFPLIDPVSNVTTYWTRISAQLYLNQTDFINLGEAVLNIL